MAATTSKSNLSHPDIARVLRLIFVVALLGVISQISLCFVNFARVAPPSFDGGMNLNVAVSLIQGKGYGFFYDSFYPFPTQTDGPFILPAAFVLWLGGITPFTTQLVNLLYLAVFAAFVYALLRNLQLEPWVALVGVVLCLRIPGMSAFAINGFGEIPCLTFYLLGLIALSSGFRGVNVNNWKLLFGGIALGLCVITKTVGLLMVGPTLFVIVLLFLIRAQCWSRTVYVFSGITIPVLSWEVFRFISVGNVQNYFSWWRLQLGQVLLQSGVSENIAGHVNAIAKAKIHLEILSSQIGLPIALIITCLAIVFIILAIIGFQQWRSRNLANLFILVSLSIVVGAYFIWWIFITPTHFAWLRRIMVGLILLEILSVVVVFIILKECVPSIAMRSLLRLVIVITAIGLVLVAQAMMAWHGGIFSSDPRPSPMDAEQITAAKLLRELPTDAKLFGYGWWQAPVLALFSGRQMMNFGHWSSDEINALPRKYLVLDGFAKIFAMEEFQRIMDASIYRVIYESPHAAIYELLLVKPYKPFQPADYAASDLASGFDALNDNYPYVHGLYPREVDHQWSSPEAGFLLRRTDQDRLLLTLSIPNQVFQRLASPSDLRLSVFSQGCIGSEFQPVAGRQTFEIPVICPLTTEPVVLEIAVRLNAHMPFVHQIDSDGRRLGFLFESARLVNSKSLAKSQQRRN